jgi:hypothetical protein
MGYDSTSWSYVDPSDAVRTYENDMSRAGSATCAGGRSSSRSITPNIVAFAPMPSANVMIAAAANPGDRLS